MSYCRWSSDDGYCDVYVYKCVHGGWVTHVAVRRQPDGCPVKFKDVMPDGKFDAKKYLEYTKAKSKWLDNVKYLELDSPHAGKSFRHSTPKECADNLITLRESGLMVPQYAIDTLMDEDSCC